MSTPGDNVEDSTEYSRYGIKDAPKTAIATPLGQVSARLLETCKVWAYYVRSERVINIKARDINVIGACKNKGIIFNYCLFVLVSLHVTLAVCAC